MNSSDIRQQLEILLDSRHTLPYKLFAICRVLLREHPHYDWVGFYLTSPQVPRMLFLGPYEGAPTEHKQIPFGKGVCGQSAEHRKEMVVQDVAQESNYLACSAETQAEIVWPIVIGDHYIGQIDIDSHSAHPFSEQDTELLKWLCERIKELDGLEEFAASQPMF